VISRVRIANAFEAIAPSQYGHIPSLVTSLTSKQQT